MTITGTYVFGPEATRRGLALNTMAHSLRSPEARAAFLADPDGYMAGFDVPKDQIDLVKAQDWLGLIKAGANSYLLMKIGATLGVGLYHQGAQERGETYEEFLASRNDPRAV